MSVMANQAFQYGNRYPDHCLIQMSGIISRAKETWVEVDSFCKANILMQEWQKDLEISDLLICMKTQTSNEWSQVYLFKIQTLAHQQSKNKCKLFMNIIMDRKVYTWKKLIDSSYLQQTPNT